MMGKKLISLQLEFLYFKCMLETHHLLVHQKMIQIIFFFGKIKLEYFGNSKPDTKQKKIIFLKILRI